ncbi:3499_t:CDS:2, partial [Funneliformis geosporum]
MGILQYGMVFYVWNVCFRRLVYGCPAVVREMEGVLTRQQQTIGVIVGPSMSCYSEATRELAATSKFSIKLLGEDNIILRLKIYAA